MSEHIINGAYVELDTIFDTRLSIMYDIDKNILRDMIENDKYHNRNIDQFGYLSVKLFRKLYGFRNDNVLNNPSGTKIPKVLRDYCIESTLTAKSYGENKPLTIYLNIFPYTLTEENKELIIMGLTNAINVPIDIEIINKPLLDIDPLFMRENISLAIMYDGMSWIEHHLENRNLETYSIPDTTLLTPMLVHRNIMLSKKDMSKFFEDIEKSVSILVNLVFTPTELFSFDKKFVELN